MNVFCLGSDEIDPLWNTFSHHLERLERDDRCCVVEVREDLREAKKQLWGLQDGPKVSGIVITAIQGQTCEIWAACGSASQRDMKAVHEQIERWAREIGCTRMKFSGRRGWLKLFKEYRQTGITAEKEL